MKKLKDIKLNFDIKNINFNKFKNIKLNTTTKVILVVFIILIFLYLLILINIKKIETELTFPWKNIDFLESNFNCSLGWLDYEEIDISDWEWNNINWIYLEWNSDKVVYYFHWNGGDISCFYNDIKYLNDLSYTVIAFDYPWYGKSTWYPYTEVVDNFANKFYDYIKREKWLDDENLIIWGFSIWTAIALDFASQNDYDKLILLAPFKSRYSLIKDYIWFIPQKLFFRKDSYINVEKIKVLENPLLIIHWNADWIISFEHWKEIYENAKSKDKYFIELDREGHNHIIPNFWDSISNIIKKYLYWEYEDFGENNYLFIDNEKKEELEFENRNNLYDDSSLQKFVTSTLSFDDKEYYPDDLVSISWKYIYDMKWWSQKLRKDSKEALDKLWEAFFEVFWRKLWIVSAFRSYNYQRWIKANWCPDNFCAKAGYSEHQTWLVVDIFEASTEISWNKNPQLLKYFIWMKQNAHLYWFHNTYQKWLEIDWYEVEPWHWRYLWVELATYLFENDLTIAEYYKMRNNLYNTLKW